jgi:hypothetical protein
VRERERQESEVPCHHLVFFFSVGMAGGWFMKRWHYALCRIDVVSNNTYLLFLVVRIGIACDRASKLEVCVCVLRGVLD